MQNSSIYEIIFTISFLFNEKFAFSISTLFKEKKNLKKNNPFLKLQAILVEVKLEKKNTVKNIKGAISKLLNINAFLESFLVNI